MITEHEIKDKLKQYEDLREEISDIVYGIWHEARESGYTKDVGSIDSWDFNDKYLFINWSDSWRYGGHDEGSEQYPIELIWSDYKEFFKKFADEKAEKEEQSKKRQEAFKEKAEKDLYEKLKQKFGDS